MISCIFVWMVKKESEIKNDEYWMRLALKMAKKAAVFGEVPVGAVIIKDNQLVAKAFNRRETWKTPIGHAEVIAIQRASQKLGSWRLNDCTLYVTLEPCVMCSGAIVQSRVDRLVYGATDPKGGAVDSLYQVVSDQRLNHRCVVESGLLKDQSQKILQEFFRSLRERNKNSKL